MKKIINQLVKGDIFMIMMISRFYFKQKNPWGEMTSYGGKLGGLHAMGYIGGGGGGVMGAPEMGGSLGTMNKITSCSSETVIMS